MRKPPVAFFCFNRPDCTKAVFEEIRRFQPTTLLLVADGPRASVPTDAERCKAVREIMQSVDWECDVRTNFAAKNMGCRNRMASGITWVFSEVEEAIILEDDCVPGPEFFQFCADLLPYYKDQPSVMAIAGTNYQEGQIRGDGSYYFSRFPHIWGWASWRRAWKHYDVDMTSWPEARSEKWIERASPPSEQEFWSALFEQAYQKKVDTWDYQWLYAIWRNGGIGIIPNANLITNIGAGRDATHTKGAPGSLEIPKGKLDALVHPKSMALDDEADRFTFDHEFGGLEREKEKRFSYRAKKKMRRVFARAVGLAGLQLTRFDKPRFNEASTLLKLGPYRLTRR